jgi:hypothetical protein
MNWVEFLTDHNIEYVSRGPNTRRGEVSVACPMCGDDPSQHLGVSLTSENWGCLRNMQHRGHAPHTLIAALLGCSTRQARLLVAQYSHADPDAPLTNPWLIDAPTAAPRAAVTLPDDCRPIRFDDGTQRFWKSLNRRGFDDPDLLTQMYGLRAATSGRWKDRIIIPIHQEGGLVGWQGRYIYGGHNYGGQKTIIPRYLSSSEEVKRTVYNLDKATGGDVLFICEGPFDAMKVDFYGHTEGARATCTFGVSLTAKQLGLLNEVGKRFKRVVLLFDPDAQAAAYDTIDWLRSCNAVIGELPPNVKDPGDLSRTQVLKLIGEYK